MNMIKRYKMLFENHSYNNDNANQRAIYICYSTTNVLCTCCPLAPVAVTR